MTDQANYVTLVDGILQPSGAEAIGYAPIIRVKLMHNGNVVDVGYTKIFIFRGGYY